MSVFNDFVPPAAADYCQSLYRKYAFTLIIKKKRLTKRGDYKYDHRKRIHIITINNDLNAYSFLITYLHEIAHLIVFTKYGRRVMPHGTEWKSEFQKLMQPVLHPDVFPDDILRSVSAYIKNPRASSCSDHRLTRALSHYDRHDKTPLSEVKYGSYFIFNKRKFKRQELKRTRYVCEEAASGKKYLISHAALVEVV